MGGSRSQSIQNAKFTATISQISKFTRARRIRSIAQIGREEALKRGLFPFLPFCMKSSSCISGGETEAIFLPSLSPSLLLSLSLSLSRFPRCKWSWTISISLFILTEERDGDDGAVQRHTCPEIEHRLSLPPKTNSGRSNFAP